MQPATRRASPSAQARLGKWRSFMTSTPLSVTRAPDGDAGPAAGPQGPRRSCFGRTQPAAHRATPRPDHTAACGGGTSRTTEHVNRPGSLPIPWSSHGDREPFLRCRCHATHQALVVPTGLGECRNPRASEVLAGTMLHGCWGQQRACTQASYSARESGMLGVFAWICSNSGVGSWHSCSRWAAVNAGQAWLRAVVKLMTCEG